MKALAKASALCLLAISGALVGCESAVNPIIGSDLPFRRGVRPAAPSIPTF